MLTLNTHSFSTANKTFNLILNRLKLIVFCFYKFYCFNNISANKLLMWMDWLKSNQLIALLFYSQCSQYCFLFFTFIANWWGNEIRHVQHEVPSSSFRRTTKCFILLCTQALLLLLSRKRISRQMRGSGGNSHKKGGRRRRGKCLSKLTFYCTREYRKGWVRPLNFPRVMPTSSQKGWYWDESTSQCS